MSAVRLGRVRDPRRVVRARRLRGPHAVGRRRRLLGLGRDAHDHAQIQRGRARDRTRGAVPPVRSRRRRARRSRRRGCARRSPSCDARDRRRCSALQSRPAARTDASASAAKPDALDARPLAVGKSFVADDARARRAERRRGRARRDRAAAWRAPSCGRRTPATTPLRTSSSSTSVASNDTVVVVLMPASVTERLGTAGTLPSPSRFPQYFASAMLGGRSPSPSASWLMATPPSRCAPVRFARISRTSSDVRLHGRREAVEALALPRREDAAPRAAFSTSATTQPPPPAPVSFAPSAPARARGRRTSARSRASRRRAPRGASGSGRGAGRSRARSPSAIARRAFFTSVWMASNVRCVVSGRRSLHAARRPRPSTSCSTTGRCGRRRGGAATGTRTRSISGAPSAERVKCTQPPSDETAASMPDGLPWNTRSQASTRAAIASGAADGIERARDRDAERRRAAEPAARRQVGLRLDVDGADGRYAGRALRLARRREQAAKRARERRRVVVTCVAHGDVPAADVHDALRVRVGAARVASAQAPRSMPTASAGTPYTTACSPKRITFPCAVPRLMPTSPRAREPRPRATACPRDASRQAPSPRARRAPRRAAPRRAPRRAPSRPTSPSPSRPRRPRHPTRRGAPSTRREQRLGARVPAHLDDERGALALADVVADGLARRARDRRRRRADRRGAGTRCRAGDRTARAARRARRRRRRGARRARAAR